MSRTLLRNLYDIQPPAISLQVLTDALGASMVSAHVNSHNSLSSVEFAYAPVGGGAWIDMPLPLPLPSSLGDGPGLNAPAGPAWAAMWSTSNLGGSFVVKATVADSAGRTAEQRQR